MLFKCEPEIAGAPLSLDNTDFPPLSTVSKSFLIEQQLLHSLSEPRVSRALGSPKSAFQVTNNEAADMAGTSWAVRTHLTAL